MSEKLPSENSEEKNQPWLKYLIALAIGGVMVFLILLSRGLFGSEPLSYMDRLKAWSDAFFIPGALLTAFGCLLFASGQGAFDGVVYAVKSLTWFFSVKSVGKKRESYADFRERRHGKKKSFGYLIVIGICFIAVAGVLNASFLAKMDLE